MANIVRRSVLAGLSGALLAQPASAAQLKVGEAAAPYDLTTFKREKISSTDLSGQVVLLNYWATWCAPCRNEMVAFDKYLRPRLDQGFRIFAIAADQVPKHWLEKLTPALAYPLVSRLKGKGYGLIRGAVPTNYVIDRKGVVRHAASGSFSLGALERIITPLLEEKV